MSDAPTIKTVNLTKSFLHGGGIIEVLKGISFEVAPKEQVAIVGASGVGKSTLLHLLGTLDSPTSGNVLINGVNAFQLSDKELSRLRNEQIGFVFQFHHLLPELTALENVLLPGLIKGEAKEGLIERSKNYLDSVGLSHRLSHKPGELSGGEQQRVAIARALVMHPKLILADEITGNLDRQTGRKVFDLLRDVAAEHKTTMIFVTHDIDLAKEFQRKLHLVDGVLSA